MTLEDMASFVTSKVRQTDAAAVARCKLFLRQRYEMIWNDALWRASVYRHDFTYEVAPAVAAASQPPFGNYWCAPAGIRALPPTVDRVLALRRTSGGLPVEQAEGLFRYGVDEFEESGTPVKFIVLPPAVVDVSSRLTATDLTDTPHALVGTASDAGKTLRIRYLDPYGQEKTESLVLDADANQEMVGKGSVILSVTKPETDGAITWSNDGDQLFVMAATATAADRHPRIQLLPKPTADTAFKCLVKKQASRLEDDSDAPEIPGVDNALMSFAQSDMLQAARQYGKAQAVAQEAIALLAQLKRLEVVQQASRCQVVPVVDEMTGDWETSKSWYV